MPQMTAQQLAASVAGLDKVAQISTEALFQLPGASLSFDNLLDCLRWAQAQVEAGADGVVFTQGTDTLEETSFLLDLYWQHPQPLVFTGAMRTPLIAGADGPANLLAAVRTAAAPASRERGVLVVMNDTVHEARRVRKCHSLAVDAFESPGGASGHMVEGAPRYAHAPAAREAVPAPLRSLPRVALVEAALGDDGWLIDTLPQNGYEGLVVAAFGVGHVSFGLAQRLEDLAKRLPVVVATRTGNGPTVDNTYGFVGSEIDLIRRGVQMAGWLCPRKVRILLAALLAADLPAEMAAKTLRRWGR